MEPYKKNMYYALYEKIKLIGEHNYIGTIVMDNQYRIVHMNEKIIDYFSNDVDNAGQFFGNIFGCYNVKLNENTCGTTEQCDNCKIRKHMIKAFKTLYISESLLVSKYFIINNELVLKWFEMTYMPIYETDSILLMVSIIDLTELMVYKIDENIYPMLSDEGFITLKEEFHTNICKELQKLKNQNNFIYFLQVSLNVEKLKKINLGTVWRSELLAKLYLFLKEITFDEDLVCRFSEEHFIVFLSNKSIEQLNQIEFKLDQFKIKELNLRDPLNYIRLKIAPREALVCLEQKNKSLDVLYTELFK